MSTCNKPGGKFVVYGYDRCPYTLKALETLKEAGLPYDYLEISGKKEQVLVLLADKIADHTTVPIIFYSGRFIGGYDSLGNCLTKLKKN